MSETGKALVPARHRRWRPIHALLMRPRFSIAMLVCLGAGIALLLLDLRWAQALLLGFDFGVLVFLLTTLRLFNRTTPERIRRLAQRQEAGHYGVLWIVVGLALVVMIALGTELHAAKSGGLLALLAAGSTIVESWLFINVMYALHYAHGYYGDFGEQHHGLDFPGKQAPDYWDFTYFAIVIGMTFQVSDVQITSRHLRRVALAHGVIAFFFNVFIIALSVNILAGQA